MLRRPPARLNTLTAGNARFAVCATSRRTAPQSLAQLADHLSRTLSPAHSGASFDIPGNGKHIAALRNTACKVQSQFLQSDLSSILLRIVASNCPADMVFHVGNSAPRGAAPADLTGAIVGAVFHTILDRVRRRAAALRAPATRSATGASEHALSVLVLTNHPVRAAQYHSALTSVADAVSSALAAADVSLHGLPLLQVFSQWNSPIHVVSLATPVDMATFCSTAARRAASPRAKLSDSDHAALLLAQPDVVVASPQGFTSACFNPAVCAAELRLILVDLLDPQINVSTPHRSAVHCGGGGHLELPGPSSNDKHSLPPRALSVPFHRDSLEQIASRVDSIAECLAPIYASVAASAAAPQMCVFSPKPLVSCDSTAHSLPFKPYSTRARSHGSTSGADVHEEDVGEEDLAGCVSVGSLVSRLRGFPSAATTLTAARTAVVVVNGPSQISGLSCATLFVPLQETKPHFPFYVTPSLSAVKCSSAASSEERTLRHLMRALNVPRILRTMANLSYRVLSRSVDDVCFKELVAAFSAVTTGYCRRKVLVFVSQSDHLSSIQRAFDVVGTIMRFCMVSMCRKMPQRKRISLPVQSVRVGFAGGLLQSTDDRISTLLGWCQGRLDALVTTASVVESTALPAADIVLVCDHPANPLALLQRASRAAMRSVPSPSSRDFRSTYSILNGKPATTKYKNKNGVIGDAPCSCASAKAVTVILCDDEQSPLVTALLDSYRQGDSDKITSADVGPPASLMWAERALSYRNNVTTLSPKKSSCRSQDIAARAPNGRFHSKYRRQEVPQNSPSLWSL